MQDLITALANGFGLFDMFSILPTTSNTLELAPEKVSIAAIFSGAGSVILGKFTGSIGYLTMPMNYSILFIGALISNWVFQGVQLPMLDATLQTPMVFTVAGMSITALALLMFTRTEQY